MHGSILIYIKPELAVFTCLMVEIDLPPFDVDAALSRIFDCFRDEATALQNLAQACDDMSDSDALFESLEVFENFQKERLYYALRNIGLKIKAHLDEIKPYVDGKLPYYYKRIFNGCALIMADVPVIGFRTGDYRTRHTGGD